MQAICPGILTLQNYSSEKKTLKQDLTLQNEN